MMSPICSRYIRICTYEIKKKVTNAEAAVVCAVKPQVKASKGRLKGGSLCQFTYSSDGLVTP